MFIVVASNVIAQSALLQHFYVTVSNTCRQYFSSFKTSLTLAGTIGITVDNRHVCIVHVLDQLLPDTPYSAKHLVVHPSEFKNGRIFQNIFTTCLKSQVGLLQTAHSWANAGVLLGAHVRRRVAFETINYRDEVSERRKVIVN